MEEIRKENEKYLALFQEYLESYGMSRKLSDQHVANMERYLNDYLADILNREMKNSVRDLEPYIKTVYIEMEETNEETLEMLIKSLNFFYRCMHEKGLMSSQMYGLYEWLVKNNKKEWIEKMSSKR